MGYYCPTCGGKPVARQAYFLTRSSRCEAGHWWYTCPWCFKAVATRLLDRDDYAKAACGDCKAAGIPPQSPLMYAQPT